MGDDAHQHGVRDHHEDPSPAARAAGAALAELAVPLLFQAVAFFLADHLVRVDVLLRIDCPRCPGLTAGNMGRQKFGLKHSGPRWHRIGARFSYNLKLFQQAFITKRRDDLLSLCVENEEQRISRLAAATPKKRTQAPTSVVFDHNGSDGSAIGSFHRILALKKLLHGPRNTERAIPNHPF